MPKRVEGEPRSRPDQVIGAAKENSRETEREPHRPHWPLLVIGVGVLLTILWTVLLGWGALELLLPMLIR
jgi:hypothetical protein